MSFSALRDIFIGRADTDYCVRSLLFLKSRSNAKNYLTNVHLVAFPGRDSQKNKRWKNYPHSEKQNVTPILQKHLLDSDFIDKHSERLSFDISRFTEFLDGYYRVSDDIKPIMLHYSMIYLLDFFSRTWLKYGRNPGHGLKWSKKDGEHFAMVKDVGSFPRTADAFYLRYESNVFSADDFGGFGSQRNIAGETVFAKIDKLKYTDKPKIRLHDLISIYENLRGRANYYPVYNSSPILVGYAILFVVSSISRYDPKGWLKTREDIQLKNKMDVLQYDFLYEWTPFILQQTILMEDLKRRLMILGD